MDKIIAYCGLDCSKCDAYIATKNNDEKLRIKTAELWSKLNGITILPEHINCEGCRCDGKKTVFCDKLCKIKQCAEDKKYQTCGDCNNIDNCNIIKMITDTNKDALNRLKGEKHDKWAFFDIGSTLVDETDCEEYRIDEALKGHDNISKEKFIDEYIKLARQNEDAYHILVKKYDLNVIKWPSFKEKKIDGIEKVLDYFKRYYKLGIIANQPLGTVDRLRNYGILDYFDVIISSEEEKVSKPDKRIFNLALQRAKIDASKAIMIGDRLENDIAPAQELGFKTIWVKRSYGKYGNPNLLSKKIDLVVDDILDLVNIDIKNMF